MLLKIIFRLFFCFVVGGTVDALNGGYQGVWEETSALEGCVKGAVSGASESIASHLTLWRYKVEKLAANNPRAYDALMAAWDLKVKTTLATGAISAAAAALETGGASLLAYGASLGTGLGIDWVAKLVAQYGADVAAANAAAGNPRLYASFKKTFDFVGEQVTRHGVRAGMRRSARTRAETQRPAATAASRSSAAARTAATVTPAPASDKRPPASRESATGDPIVRQKLLWGSYPKVTQGGREYARIGDRLYTEHAVSRMQPSSLGRFVSSTGANTKEGMSMSPTFVEDVINRGSQTEVITPSGVKRVVHSLGSAKVYTEQGGTIVVTVNSLRGGE